MKCIKEKMVHRTNTQKREGNKDKEHRHRSYLFLGMSLAVVLLLIGIGVAGATTIYVATDGGGDYNCDGTDDQVEINWALANASTDDIVHVKAGTYSINDLIWINNSYITFEGVGASTILQMIPKATTDSFAQCEFMINLNGNDITFQNLVVDGNRATQTLPSGRGYLSLIHTVTPNCNKNVVLRNCTIQETIDDAFEASTVENLYVGNNNFTNVQHDAVSGSWSDSIIEDNTILMDDASGNAAFRLYHGDNNTFRNNTIDRVYPHFYAHGFEIHAFNNLNLSGNVFENNTINGVLSRGIGLDTSLGGTPNNDLSTMRGIVIRNNMINEVMWSGPPYEQGIYLGGLWDNVTIENNVITGTGSSGIHENGAAGDIQVKNNIIVNNEGYGVTGDNIISSYNDIWNNDDGNYNGVSADTTDICKDPLFADPTNDFHLKSEYGRWDGTDWVTDNETSPCIGAGELNGEKINMGAYGNTVEASINSDITPIYPTITPHSPAGTAVPVETTITVTFNKAMNTVSTEGAFSISPDVQGAFSWIETEMIFTPDSNLDYERTYTVTLNAEAEDFEGNNMRSPFNWQFTTRAPGMDLVAEWHFEEGSGDFAEDTSVNTNNGTLVNMDVTAWVTSKNGTALQFDGIEGYVDCGNNPVLDLTDAITIEMWLNPNVAGEGGPNAGPVSKDEPGVDWSWQLRYNAPGGGNYMGFQFNGDPEGSSWVSVNQNLTPGEWYHIAGTFDGTTIRCYLNGVETDTNLLSAIKSGNARLFIGQDGWGNIFNGVVDELKIYNRALTAEEIQADYEAGFVELNSLSGTVTSPCGTKIANVTVTLTTRAGAEINTTQTDSTGHYAFANVNANFYNINATKRGYWPDINNVTVTAEAPKTADIVLCKKGDFNTNDGSADAGDLAMMADATKAGTSDVTYDLDGDGYLANENDLTLLKDVSVGLAELE